MATVGPCPLQSLPLRQGLLAGTVQSEEKAADPRPPLLLCQPRLPDATGRCPPRGPAMLGREHLPALGPMPGVCLGMPRGHVGSLSLPRPYGWPSTAPHPLTEHPQASRDASSCSYPQSRAPSLSGCHSTKGSPYPRMHRSYYRKGHAASSERKACICFCLQHQLCRV